MLEEKNTKAKKNNEEEFIDVEMPEIAKKRFRFDGDNNRVAYINTSDFSVVKRMEDGLPKLKALAAEAAEKLADESNEDSVGTILTDIDAKMRKIIDEIFDEGVSDAAAPKGSSNMFDLHDGEFTFEHVIDVVSKLYENNMNEEYKKLNSRLQKYTNKYTGKKKK